MARTSTRSDQASPDERTVRIARKQFVRRQWARRWLAWRRLLAALVVLAVLVGAGWLVFFSSVLTVKGVQVVGLHVLQPAKVRQVAAVPLGQPLATVSTEAIAARVQGLAPVKAVDVSRSWPDKIRIAVVERKAVAVVERNSVVRGVDGEGVLFRTYRSVPHGLPVIRVSAKTHSDALAEAAKVIDTLPDDIAAKVDHLSVETVDSITLQLRNGKTVRWGSADESQSKAEVLEVLLRQKASVYDVSVPAQPTLKP